MFRRAAKAGALGSGAALALAGAALSQTAPAFAPCFARTGTTEAFVAGFETAGWRTLIEAGDRRAAAAATGEPMVLVRMFPPRPETTEQADELLQQMHRTNLDMVDIEVVLFFQRDDLFAMVQPVDAMPGIDRVSCLVTGPDMPTVERMLAGADRDRPGLGGGLSALSHAPVVWPDPFGLYPDLRVDALELVLGFTPTEPVYGPFSVLVDYGVEQ